MSVRFDASGDALSRSAADIVAANAAAYSMCCWCKRKVDTGAFATVLYSNVASNPGGAGELFMETTTGGDTISCEENPTASVMAGPTLTIGTWFFLGYQRTNTARALYYGTETGGTLTKVANTDTRNFTTDMDVFYIGNDPYTEPFDGEVALVRLWSTNLSDAEMDAEWRSLVPVKTANLRGDWRLAAAASAATDSSGNTLTLTVGGTLADGGVNPVPPSGLPNGFLQRMLSSGRRPAPMKPGVAR